MHEPRKVLTTMGVVKGGDSRRASLLLKKVASLIIVVVIMVVLWVEAHVGILQWRLTRNGWLCLVGREIIQ